MSIIYKYKNKILTTFAYAVILPGAELAVMPVAGEVVALAVLTVDNLFNVGSE